MSIGLYFILSQDDGMYILHVLRALENTYHRKRQVKYIMYKIGELFLLPTTHVSAHTYSNLSPCMINIEPEYLTHCRLSNGK